MVQRLFNGLPGSLRNLAVGFLNKRGFTRGLSSFRSEAVFNRVEELLGSSTYDTLIVEYVWHAYLAGAAPDGVLKILDTHDISHLRAASYVRQGLIPDKTVTKEDELEAFRQFDYLLAIQREEQAYLETVLPGRSLLAMHPHPLCPNRYSERLAGSGSDDKLILVYFSAYADANMDALQWFLDEIWNESLTDDFELRVYGGICEGLGLCAPGISLQGKVKEVGEVYDQADIAINPQRIGSGLKIKSVEALANGIPLVTTSVGAQGLEQVAGKAYCVADDAAAFLQSLRTLRDPAIRRRLSESALAYAEANLSPDACFRNLKETISRHCRMEQRAARD